MFEGAKSFFNLKKKYIYMIQKRKTSDFKINASCL